MSTRDEDCKRDRFGKFGIIYRNEEGLTKSQIIEKFSTFSDDDLTVSCMTDSNSVFVHFKEKENAIKARKAFPELRADFAHDGKFERKRRFYNSEDDSNKAHNSMASTCNGQSYQNSKTSIAKSTENYATPDSDRNKKEQNNNSGYENKNPENKESTQAGGSSAQKSHSFNGSLDESAENYGASGSGQNYTEQKKNFGERDEKPETKESNPSASNCNSSLNGSDVDLDEIPLLVSSYEVDVMENLRTVETTVVVLCNLPPWYTFAGDVYKLIFQHTGLYPLEIEMFRSERRIVQHFAYLHFRNLIEAETCMQGMNYLWVDFRQLICVLLDDIPLTRN